MSYHELTYEGFKCTSLREDSLLRRLWFTLQVPLITFCSFYLPFSFSAGMSSDGDLSVRQSSRNIATGWLNEDKNISAGDMLASKKETSEIEIFGDMRKTEVTASRFNFGKLKARLENLQKYQGRTLATYKSTKSAISKEARLILASEKLDSWLEQEIENYTTQQAKSRLQRYLS